MRATGNLLYHLVQLVLALRQSIQSPSRAAADPRYDTMTPRYCRVDPTSPWWEQRVRGPRACHTTGGRRSDRLVSCRAANHR